MVYLSFRLKLRVFFIVNPYYCKDPMDYITWTLWYESYHMVHIK